MSERFSRKEFVKSTRLNLYPWRVAWSVSGMIGVEACFLWMFPVEKYGITRQGAILYCIEFLIFAVTLAWFLLRQNREKKSFSSCPNCGERIFIVTPFWRDARLPEKNGRFYCASVKDKTGKGIGAILNISLRPRGIVLYNDGICPHCKQCVWRKEAEYQAKRIPYSALRDLDSRVIPTVAAIMMMILTAVAWGYFLSVMLPRPIDAFLAKLFIALTLLVPVLRLNLGLSLKFWPLGCPACGAKWLDTDIEERTGRCHCCGELVVDLPDDKPATSPTGGTEAEK